jgi:hypothetical protein
LKKFSRHMRRLVLALTLDKRGMSASDPATYIAAAAALVGGGIAATSTLNQTSANANATQTSSTALGGKLAGMVGGTATAASASTPGI